MEEAQKDFNDYFKNKRDQYLIEIRKNKNSRFLTAKRLKFTESTEPKPEDVQNDQTPKVIDPFEVNPAF